MKNTLLLFCCCLSQWAFAHWSKTYLIVGTYTDGKPSKGIYVFEFDTLSGELKKVTTGNQITNPSFLNLSSNGRFLYACTETKLPYEGSVSAFQFDSLSGQLRFINQQKSGGFNPVYLSSSSDMQYVINANYTEGTVTLFPCNADGSLRPYQQHIQFEGSGLNAFRQDKAHVHAAVFSPDGQYLFFPDLGADKIRAFQFDTSNVQVLVAKSDMDYKAMPGSGPRHMTFHPNQKFAYCIEELSGTVTAFNYHSGQLDSIQRVFANSKIHEVYSGADIHVSPDGLFLYVSNRLEDENTIAIFAIHQVTGQLNFIAHQSTVGDHPRNFCIDPTGRFLLVANMLSNHVRVFKRDVQTGLLQPTKISIKVPSPSCLLMRTFGE